MNEELLLRAARDAEWQVPVTPASEIRSRAARRRRGRRTAAGLAAAGCGIAAIAVGSALTGADTTTASDSGGDELRVGSVVLDDLPDGWSVTRAAGTSAMAHACLGPDAKPCSVHVLALYEPARDSGIDWFSLLTLPCLSPKSTSVLSADAEVPAGPARVHSLECQGPGGAISNTAWVLDAGVAVVPDSADEVDEGDDVVDGLRFADGRPTLPPPLPSEQPSAEPSDSR